VLFPLQFRQKLKTVVLQVNQVLHMGTSVSHTLSSSSNTKRMEWYSDLSHLGCDKCFWWCHIRGVSMVTSCYGYSRAWFASDVSTWMSMITTKLQEKRRRSTHENFPPMTHVRRAVAGSWIALPLKMGLTRCPETLLRDYQSTLCQISQEGSPCCKLLPSFDATWSETLTVPVNKN